MLPAWTPIGNFEPLGGAIDRPIGAPPQRHLAHRQHQHLNEALVGGAALDLFRRRVRVHQRHHDRGAQPRLLVEPFLRHPIVHRAAQSGAEIGVEDRHRAVEAIGDRIAQLELVERVVAQQGEVAAGLALFAGASRARLDSGALGG